MQYPSAEKSLETFNQLVEILIVQKKAKWLGPYMIELLFEGERRTLSSLIHGNETASMQVVLEFLTLIEKNLYTPQCRPIITLGNIPAFIANQRFCQRDLNRCFNYLGEEEEASRAKELEKIFEKSEYVLDMHQTQRKTSASFFVVPATEESLKLAHTLDSMKKIVSLGGPLEGGVTVTKFCRSKGIPACTVELGERGNDFYQIHHGLFLLMKFFGFKSSELSLPEKFFKVCKKVYLDKGELLEHMDNFTYVNLGDEITKGEDNNSSDFSGYIIFPKFPKKDKVDKKDPILQVLKEENDIKCL